MRRLHLVLVWLCLTVACKPTERSGAAPAAPVSGPAGKAGPAPDQAALVARSEQLYRAMDEADADAVASMFAPDFMRVTMARIAA